MDEKRLDDLLDDAARSWRVPPPAPIDDIWQRVTSEAFTAAPPRRWLDWRTMGVAAAALLVGGLVGRGLRPASAPTAAIAPVVATTSNDPAVRATEHFLGQTAMLLAALPSDRDAAAFDPQLVKQGALLLTQTRLLLGSPAADNERLRTLLLDLELVLAQVARMERRSDREELSFIRTTLDQHDIVPRLHTAVTELSSSDNSGVDQ